MTAARLLSAAVSVGDAQEAPLPFRGPASHTIFARYSWLMDPEMPGWDASDRETIEDLAAALAAGRPRPVVTAVSSAGRS